MNRRMMLLLALVVAVVAIPAASASHTGAHHNWREEVSYTAGRFNVTGLYAVRAVEAGNMPVGKAYRLQAKRRALRAVLNIATIDHSWKQNVVDDCGSAAATARYFAWSVINGNRQWASVRAERLLAKIGRCKDALALMPPQ